MVRHYSVRKENEQSQGKHTCFSSFEKIYASTINNEVREKSYCPGQREQRKTNTSEYYNYSRESPFIISEKRRNLRTLVGKV